VHERLDCGGGEQRFERDRFARLTLSRQHYHPVRATADFLEQRKSRRDALVGPGHEA